MANCLSMLISQSLFISSSLLYPGVSTSLNVGMSHDLLWDPHSQPWSLRGLSPRVGFHKGHGRGWFLYSFRQHYPGHVLNPVSKATAPTSINSVIPLPCCSWMQSHTYVSGTFQNILSGPRSSFILSPGDPAHPWWLLYYFWCGLIPASGGLERKS